MSGPEIACNAARLVYDAEAALIRCADGAEAIRLLMGQYRGGGAGADAARNAAGWCAEKLAADIEAASGALDRIRFDREAITMTERETQP